MANCYKRIRLLHEVMACDTGEQIWGLGDRETAIYYSSTNV